MVAMTARRIPKPLSITSHDIAKEAGVSQSTVSRALRGDPRVDPKTAARIVRVADRRGYMPNATARSLVTRRTRTIAVVVADIKNPFYPELVEALHEALGRSGYRMVLVNERTDTRGQAGLAELYRGGGADGALFVSATIERRVAALVSKSPVPSVLLNRDVDGADVDRVMADNAGGAAQVAELLHGLGHRRIAFIAGPANTSTSRDREAGFSKALTQRGAPLDPALRRVGEFTHRSGYQWATDLLDRPDRPTAVFCANDVVAFGALDAARNLGLDAAQCGLDRRLRRHPHGELGRLQPHHRAPAPDGHGARRGADPDRPRGGPRGARAPAPRVPHASRPALDDGAAPRPRAVMRIAAIDTADGPRLAELDGEPRARARFRRGSRDARGRGRRSGHAGARG